MPGSSGNTSPWLLSCVVWKLIQSTSSKERTRQILETLEAEVHALKEKPQTRGPSAPREDRFL
jgi:hypothetical protein